MSPSAVTCRGPAAGRHGAAAWPFPCPVLTEGHAGGAYSRFTDENTEAGGGITETVQVSLAPQAVRLPLQLETTVSNMWNLASLTHPTVTADLC